jgi:hypothetical protein
VQPDLLSVILRSLQEDKLEKERIWKEDKLESGLKKEDEE